MTDYTAAWEEAEASAPVDIIELDTLALRHPALLDEFDQPFAIYVVLDATEHDFTIEADADFDAGLVRTFSPVAFQLIDYTRTGSGARAARVAIDNVSEDIMPHIRAIAAARGSIEIVHRVYFASDPTTVQAKAANMTLREFQVTPFQIVGDLTYRNMDRITIPGLRYTPDDFAGLST